MHAQNWDKNLRDCTKSFLAVHVNQVCNTSTWGLCPVLFLSTMWQWPMSDTGQEFMAMK